MARPKKLHKGIVSEDKLRADVIKVLEIDDLKPEIQEEIIVNVRDTILENINIAIMRALGEKGMMALGDIEENSEAFANKLIELLPNLGEIVGKSMEESLAAYRETAGKIRSQFGISPQTSNHAGSVTHK